MHGQMHPNYGLVTSVLAYDPLSSLVYPMTAHTPMVASNLPTVKTLVARQWPTIIIIIIMIQLSAALYLYWNTSWITFIQIAVTTFRTIFHALGS